MNYSDCSNHCRVDFFKESGKWYCTEAVVFIEKYYDNCLIHDAFKKALLNHFDGKRRLSDMTAICLEPYHMHSHPISLKVSEIFDGD